MLAGFSGGSDSTALAIGMAEARRSRRLRPWLAYVEHRVRPESTEDVSVVLTTAERLRLPISIRSIPDGTIASHMGVGPEEAMRRERYLLLASTADETGSSAVLTAHHADDQAETVLGHLIRGSGLEGAAGIHPSTMLTVPWWPVPATKRSLSVVRPLLAERRRDLAGLVAERELSTIVDETNRDVDRTRAALRHQVLPILDAIHPDAAMSLARFGEIARAAVEHASPMRTALCDEAALDIASLGGSSIGARRHIVRTWVLERTGINLGFERTEAIRRWLASDGAGRLEIGGGWSISRAGRTITVHSDTRDRRPNAT